MAWFTGAGFGAGAGASSAAGAGASSAAGGAAASSAAASGAAASGASAAGAGSAAAAGAGSAATAGVAQTLGVQAVAGGASAAAGGTAASAAATSTLLTQIAQGFSIVQGISALGNGAVQNAIARSNAKFEAFNQGQVAVEILRESNVALDQFLDTIGQQNVAFSANGIDLSFGTPQAIAGETLATADRQLEGLRLDGAVAEATSRARQRSLLLEADNALIGGIGGAAGAAGNGLLRRAGRG